MYGYAYYIVYHVCANEIVVKIFVELESSYYLISKQFRNLEEDLQCNKKQKCG